MPHHTETSHLDNREIRKLNGVVSQSKKIIDSPFELGAEARELLITLQDYLEKSDPLIDALSGELGKRSKKMKACLNSNLAILKGDDTYYPDERKKLSKITRKLNKEMASIDNLINVTRALSHGSSVVEDAISTMLF